jgi:hypothetical protein
MYRIPFYEGILSLVLAGTDLHKRVRVKRSEELEMMIQIPLLQMIIEKGIQNNQEIIKLKELLNTYQMNLLSPYETGHSLVEITAIRGDIETFIYMMMFLPDPGIDYSFVSNLVGRGKEYEYVLNNIRKWIHSQCDDERELEERMKICFERLKKKIEIEKKRGRYVDVENKCLKEMELKNIKHLEKPTKISSFDEFLILASCSRLYMESRTMELYLRAFRKCEKLKNKILQDFDCEMQGEIQMYIFNYFIYLFIFINFVKGVFVLPVT